jgi:hypothetical protein
MGKIITEHVYPPIPVRQFDWSAVRDGYEPGCPLGTGPTERDAINDLLDQEADASDDTEEQVRRPKAGANTPLIPSGKEV